MIKKSVDTGVGRRSFFAFLVPALLYIFKCVWYDKKTQKMKGVYYELYME